MDKYTEKQREIIEIALEIISREGVKRLTIKNLSNKKKVTEAAIYRHFKRKKDIIYAIFDVFERLTNEVLVEIEKTNGPLERIEKFLVSRYKLFESQPNWVSVMFSDDIFIHDKDIMEKNLNIMKLHRKHVVEWINSGVEKGEIRKDIQQENLFKIIIGSMRLLVVQWKSERYQFGLLEKGSKLWDDVLRILV